MKKLILLSLMMLVCGRSFSQIGTQNKVSIDTILAKKIAVDLIMGDECKEEIKIVKSNLNLLKEKVVIKDTIINAYKKQIINLNKMLEGKDKLLEISDENLDSYKKQLSKSNKNNLLFKGTTLITIGVSLLLILK